MCYDNLEEIGRVVEVLRRNYADREQAAVLSMDDPVTDTILSAAEFSLIINRRIELAETRLRELGFEPKKRVQEGDFAKEATARGITLPGQIPGSDPAAPAAPTTESP